MYIVLHIDDIEVVAFTDPKSLSVSIMETGLKWSINKTGSVLASSSGGSSGRPSSSQHLNQSGGRRDRNTINK